MNVWGGGSYSHNTEGTSSASSGLVTVSTDWSIKGDESFLWESSESQIKDLVRLSSDLFESGTWTLKMDVLNLSSSFSICLFNNTENQVRVTVPESNDVTHVELSLEVGETNFLSCRVISTNPAKFHCDNISMVHQ